MTTAPIGTSSIAAARRACSNAAAIAFPRPPSPVPVLGTHGLPRLLKYERVSVLRPIDSDAVALRVLSLEHRDGERILEQPLNRSLERARPVDGIVALGHQQVLRGGCDVDRQLAVGQQPLDTPDLDVDDLLDIVVRQ